MRITFVVRAGQRLRVGSCTSVQLVQEDGLAAWRNGGRETGLAGFLLCGVGQMPELIVLVTTDQTLSKPRPSVLIQIGLVGCESRDLVAKKSVGRRLNPGGYHFWLE